MTLICSSSSSQRLLFRRLFLQLKEFEVYWGAVFFLKDMFTHFHKFSSNWNSDFGHAVTQSEAKRRVVLRREFSSL